MRLRRRWPWRRRARRSRARRRGRRRTAPRARFKKRKSRTKERAGRPRCLLPKRGPLSGKQRPRARRRRARGPRLPSRHRSGSWRREREGRLSSLSHQRSSRSKTPSVTRKTRGGRRPRRGAPMPRCCCNRVSVVLARGRSTRRSALQLERLRRRRGGLQRRQMLRRAHRRAKLSGWHERQMLPKMLLKSTRGWAAASSAQVSLLLMREPLAASNGIAQSAPYSMYPTLASARLAAHRDRPTTLLLGLPRRGSTLLSRAPPRALPPRALPSRALPPRALPSRALPP